MMIMDRRIEKVKQGGGGRIKADKVAEIRAEVHGEGGRIADEGRAEFLRI